jgi:hypothetical protein
MDTHAKINLLMSETKSEIHITQLKFTPRPTHALNTIYITCTF